MGTMKVKEVYFEKLFSLERYCNERIGFRAEVSENENPDKVAGELFFKIMEIEDCLNVYRNVLTDIDVVSRQIVERQHDIARIKKEIADLKTTIEELARLSEKGDVDAKLRHACNSRSYKQLSEQLKNYENELAELNEKHKRLVAIKEELKIRFRNGVFTLHGIDYTPMSKMEFLEE
jgi:DNA repair exonuclease SbcCD ATPase subunit